MMFSLSWLAQIQQLRGTYCTECVTVHRITINGMHSAIGRSNHLKIWWTPMIVVQNTHRGTSIFLRLTTHTVIVHAKSKKHELSHLFSTFAPETRFRVLKTWQRYQWRVWGPCHLWCVLATHSSFIMEENLRMFDFGESNPVREFLWIVFQT